LETLLVPNRANDWLKQAERDLEHARHSRASEWHEWACFASHQAAEKALKALHLHERQEAWGHVVADLVAQLPKEREAPSDFVDKGKVLDNFYIPTRYPNGHPSGAPFEHFGPLQSEQAIQYASEIVEFVRAQMAG
jgi:HEPN domain-containing protein